MNGVISQTTPRKSLSDCAIKVDVGAPFVWLSKGWADFLRAPRLSIMHGLLYSVLGLIIAVGLNYFEMQYLLYPLTSAFILVGPILALGIYDISRRFDFGSQPKIGLGLFAWRKNSYQILMAGFVFVLFAMLWSRFAVLIFALSFPHAGMNLGMIVHTSLFTIDGFIFLLTGSIIGAIMATVAFVFGVITLPMMLDRKVDVFTAGIISFWVVMRNKGVMLTWAGLIVIFVGAGLVTAYIGLAVTLPVIGFASWHAYRACVDPSAWEKTPLD